MSRILSSYISLNRNFTTSRAMSRTYGDAIAALNTLQSNAAVVEHIKKTGRVKYDQAIPEMAAWCKRIGYSASDFDQLSPIHIAGTKGKGSTAAFISSILTKFIDSPCQTISDHRTRRLSKVGLYTSPHLRFVRERIQINGQPLTEEQFAKYFFETWDRLEATAREAGMDVNAPGAKPMYFNFLTVMAFHAYMSEGVEAAIIECGIGGRYDVTNVIQQPIVTGITNLELDHIHVLGKTIPEIAWQKAGIMKTGAKCFTTTTQPVDAREVLERCAAEVGTELVYVDVDPRIQSGEVELGLEADFQKINASVASAIAREWLTQRGFSNDGDFDMKIDQGLKDVKWSGRCETRRDGNLTWYIDGGHTLTSIRLAGQWYAGAQQKHPSTQSKRYLIFNQQTRDASSLARALHETLSTTLGSSRPFTHVIFCTNTTYKETGYKADLVSINTNAGDVAELKVQKELAETWKQLDPNADVSVVKTIEEAIQTTKQAASDNRGEVSALVTGSLHLVGGFLEVLESRSHP